METTFSKLTKGDKVIMVFAYTVLGLFMAAIILPVDLYRPGLLY